MCSAPPERARRWGKAALVCLLLLPALVFARGGAPPPTLDLPPRQGEFEAWLITVAPGEVYWQRFGHNAIWLREPGSGLDHTFNFGYFDFAQEDFFLRFLTGRMLYQSLAFSAREEFAGYAREGRSILAQRLDLDSAAYQRLRDHLVWHVQPANRDYLYDYYLDNCSTRVRDALDLALGGALAADTVPAAARQGFRDHTRRLTSMTWWYYLGLETVLGHPVDRSVSRWEEMFIPMVLSEVVAGDGVAEPLAVQNHWIYGDGRALPPTEAGAVWSRYLAVSLALLSLSWLAARYFSDRMQWLARAGFGLAGLLGLAMLALWAFTDHRVVGPNANLLLLNPLYLAVLTRQGASLVWPLALAGGAITLVQGFWPGWQYNLDVVALLLPLELAGAWLLAQRMR